jgi:hypothetical protein
MPAAAAANGAQTMHARLDAFLRSQREQHGDRLLTVLTILLLLLIFLFTPLHASGYGPAQFLAGAAALALIVGAVIVSGSGIATFLLSLALFLNLAVVVNRLLGHRSIVDLYLAATAWSIFAVTLGWIVAKAVFGPGAVNYHRIIGAVLLYLLISLGFSALFVFVGLLSPNSFSGITFEDSPALTGTVLYFSIVTLTSTGYGDMFPVHPVARSLCNLETILGQLYPATLLARLVSLEIENRRRP